MKGFSGAHTQYARFTQQQFSRVPNICSHCSCRIAEAMHEMKASLAFSLAPCAHSELILKCQFQVATASRPRAPIALRPGGGRRRPAGASGLSVDSSRAGESARHVEQSQPQLLQFPASCPDAAPASPPPTHPPLQTPTPSTTSSS